MSNGLLRTWFSFGTESEVRYIVELPAVGDFVRHHHELWRVSAAGEDQGGLYVVCEQALPPTSEAGAELV